MAFCADDGESSERGNFVVFLLSGGVSSEHNISSATCHVRSNRNSSFTSCLSNDFGFLLVVLGVEYVVRDSAGFEEFAHAFGVLD